MLPATGSRRMTSGGVRDVHRVARPEMWASLAIAAMWVAVFVTAIWGPDAQFHSVDGSSSTIPSAIFVTVFAFLGTWIVARYGFRQRKNSGE
jgi:hypothetical protein